MAGKPPKSGKSGNIIMRKLLIGAAALAIFMSSAPAIAQQSSAKPGALWNAARIDVEDGQYENYMDFLMKVWAPNQEFAKSQGWISDYYILDNFNSRDGEPDIILITRFNEFPSNAEIERRNAIMNERMKQDDHSGDAASGQRTKMRTLMGSVMYREMVKR
jgi:hypothetical protein